MKILVPVDGSENSMRAVKYAAKLAKSHPSDEFILVTVASLGDPVQLSALESPYTSEQITNACKAEYRPGLERAKKLFEEESGLSVEAELISGIDPGKAILDYANDNGAEKIIMGSRGLGAFSGMMLGSVSNKILSLSKLPVTIIK